jgi:hypothetical protein
LVHKVKVTFFGKDCNAFPVHGKAWPKAFVPICNGVFHAILKLVEFSVEGGGEVEVRECESVLR